MTQADQDPAPAYLHGFGNEHESEALPGALPRGQFNPQRVAYGLYAEQFSTTAFTAPRQSNRRSWLYRIRPSVVQGPFEALSLPAIATAGRDLPPPPANPLRWDPLPLPEVATDFVDGLVTVACCGDALAQRGMAVHLYGANQSMTQRVFRCADGEWLLVPQSGQLRLHTECGRLDVGPGWIAVVPRGMSFRVELLSATARGYACENYGVALELPERGPVGANGFANDRDFQYPHAHYEDLETPHELVYKQGGECYRADLDHSPLDVVAWTGNSAPYRYELGRFNTMGSVSYDHPDPSIFTVLTSPSETAGVANLDFVIFPPRWMVAEDTFRPPWFHRNVMSEFMGLVEGVYDAKEAGFVPGGYSLHNGMTAHGPEAAVFERASRAELAPERYRDTLAFMLESRYLMQATPWALQTPQRQRDYQACWAGLRRHFDPAAP